MKPKEFHEACHEACMECPQFVAYDYDQYVGGELFGELPRKGLFAVYTFWKDHPLLIDKGYINALSVEAQDVFERIERVIEEAIKKEFA